MALINKIKKNARFNVHEQPTWITSSLCGIECDSVATVLFQFPKTIYGPMIYIHAVMAHTPVAFTDTGADILVGLGTVAAFPMDSDDTVTAVDADSFFATGEMTLTVGAITPGAGTFVGTQDAPAVNKNYVACSDTAVPVIYMTMDATAAMAGAGKVELCALVSRVPFGR